MKTRQLFVSDIFSQKIRKALARGLAVVFLYSTIVVPLAEANFWAERRKAVKAIAGGQPFVDVTPSPQPLVFHSQHASLPKSFTELNVSQLVTQLPPLTAQTFTVPLPQTLKDAVSDQPNRELASLLNSLTSTYGTVRKAVIGDQWPVAGQKVQSPQPKTHNEPLRPVVVHIQDVHLNPEAQRNIGQTIQELINQNRVDLVALEGAFAPIDLSRFRSFPHKDVIGKVADYLLREGKISGPIHTAFISLQKIPPFIGVDDGRHYHANVAAYKQSMLHLEEYKRRLAERRQELTAQKAHTFSPALKKFDEKVDQYRYGQLSLGEYVEFLSGSRSYFKTLLASTTPLSPPSEGGDGQGPMAPSASPELCGGDSGEVKPGFEITSKPFVIPAPMRRSSTPFLTGLATNATSLEGSVAGGRPEGGPVGAVEIRQAKSDRHVPVSMVQTFLEVWHMEKSLDFAQVEAERRQLIEALVEKLDKATITELVNWSVAYRLGQVRHADFYKYLEGLWNVRHEPRATSRQFQAMDQYIQYVLLSDSIDAEKLFAEIQAFEREGYERLAETQEEKRLVAESKYLHLVGKLLDFSLTPEDWKEYEQVKTERWRAAGKKSHEPGPMILDLELTTFETFYRKAESRDKAIAANLLEAMSVYESRAPSDEPRLKRPLVAVLVTGGFHSQGIDQILHNAGITTLTYVPKISKVDAAEGSKYLSVFIQEKTPLEKLFEGDKLFVSPEPFSRASHAMAALATTATAVLYRQEASRVGEFLETVAPGLFDRVEAHAEIREKNQVLLTLDFKKVGESVKSLMVTVLTDRTGEILNVEQPAGRPLGSVGRFVQRFLNNSMTFYLRLAGQVMRNYAHVYEWPLFVFLSPFTPSHHVRILNLHNNASWADVAKRLVGLEGVAQSGRMAGLSAHRLYNQKFPEALLTVPLKENDKPGQIKEFISRLYNVTPEMPYVGKLLRHQRATETLLRRKLPKGELRIKSRKVERDAWDDGHIDWVTVETVESGKPKRYRIGFGIELEERTIYLPVHTYGVRKNVYRLVEDRGLKERLYSFYEKWLASRSPSVERRPNDGKLFGVPGPKFMRKFLKNPIAWHFIRHPSFARLKFVQDTFFRTDPETWRGYNVDAYQQQFLKDEIFGNTKTQNLMLHELMHTAWELMKKRDRARLEQHFKEKRFSRLRDRILRHSSTYKTRLLNEANAYTFESLAMFLQRDRLFDTPLYLDTIRLYVELGFLPKWMVFEGELRVPRSEYVKKDGSLRPDYYGYAFLNYKLNHQAPPGDIAYLDERDPKAPGASPGSAAPYLPAVQAAGRWPSVARSLDKVLLEKITGKNLSVYERNFQVHQAKKHSEIREGLDVSEKLAKIAFGYIEEDGVPNNQRTEVLESGEEATGRGDQKSWTGETEPQPDDILGLGESIQKPGRRAAYYAGVAVVEKGLFLGVPLYFLWEGLQRLDPGAVGVLLLVNLVFFRAAHVISRWLRSRDPAKVSPNQTSRHARARGHLGWIPTAPGGPLRIASRTGRAPKTRQPVQSVTALDTNAVGERPEGDRPASAGITIRWRQLAPVPWNGLKADILKELLSFDFLFTLLAYNALPLGLISLSPLAGIQYPVSSILIFSSAVLAHFGWDARSTTQQRKTDTHNTLSTFKMVWEDFLAGFGIFLENYSQKIMSPEQAVDEVLRRLGQRRDGRGLLVSIDGPVSAGKDTLSEYLVNRFRETLGEKVVARFDRDFYINRSLDDTAAELYAYRATGDDVLQEKSVIIANGIGSTKLFRKEMNFGRSDIAIYIWKNPLQRFLNEIKAISWDILNTLERLRSGQWENLFLAPVLNLLSLFWLVLLIPADLFHFVFLPEDALDVIVTKRIHKPHDLHRGDGYRDDEDRDMLIKLTPSKDEALGLHKLKSDDSETPTRMIGPFVVERKIPGGYHADIYKGYLPERPDKAVVVKTIPRWDMKVELLQKVGQSLKRESEILKEISQKDGGQKALFPAFISAEIPRPKDPYLAMEYIDGMILQKLIYERKPPKSQEDIEYWLSIFAQILKGLEWLHSELGHIHADIKPENIMVNTEGKVKIIDFGIAQQFGKGQPNWGTPPYMAPEQKNGISFPSADVYAVGATLYETLTGESLLYKEGAALFPPDSNIPQQLRQIVQKSLEKDPQDRFQSAGEMLADLLSFAKGEGLNIDAPGENDQALKRTIFTEINKLREKIWRKRENGRNVINKYKLNKRGATLLTPQSLEESKKKKKGIFFPGISYRTLSEYEKELGLNPVDLITKKALSDPERQITVLDWGVGQGVALLMLARYFEKSGIQNVRFIGVSKVYFPFWELVPAKVTFILDDGRNLSRYFDAGEIDVVVSVHGLRYLRNKSYAHHLKTLHSLLHPDGVIVDATGRPKILRTLHDLFHFYPINSKILKSLKGTRLTPLLISLAHSKAHISIKNGYFKNIHWLREQEVQKPALLGQIGPYQIVEEVGKGTVRLVYRGFLEGNPGVKYLVKTTRPLDNFWADDYMDQETSIKSLKVEAEILRKIRGEKEWQVSIFPELVSMDLEDEDHPFIAMEDIEAVTLKEFVDGRGPPKNISDMGRYVYILSQVLLGLQWLHGTFGVLHRDITSDHILIDQKSGNIKIIDLGIAISNGAVNDGKGTALYKAPEQFRDSKLEKQKTLDFRTDIYAVGRILEEIMYGSLPMEANEEFPLPQEYETIKPIMRKALADQPEDRFGSAQEMLESLLEFSRGIDVEIPISLKSRYEAGSSEDAFRKKQQRRTVTQAQSVPPGGDNPAAILEWERVFTRFLQRFRPKMGDQTAKYLYRFGVGPWLEEAVYGLLPVQIVAVFLPAMGWGEFSNVWTALVVFGLYRWRFVQRHQGMPRGPPTVVSIFNAFMVVLYFVTPLPIIVFYIGISLAHTLVSRFDNKTIISALLLTLGLVWLGPINYALIDYIRAHQNEGLTKMLIRFLSNHGLDFFSPISVLSFVYLLFVILRGPGSKFNFSWKMVFGSSIIYSFMFEVLDPMGDGGRPSPYMRGLTADWRDVISHLLGFIAAKYIFESFLGRLSRKGKDSSSLLSPSVQLARVLVGALALIQSGPAGSEKAALAGQINKILAGQPLVQNVETLDGRLNFIAQAVELERIDQPEFLKVLQEDVRDRFPGISHEQARSLVQGLVTIGTKGYELAEYLSETAVPDHAVTVVVVDESMEKNLESLIGAVAPRLEKEDLILVTRTGELAQRVALSPALARERARAHKGKIEVAAAPEAFVSVGEEDGATLRLSRVEQLLTLDQYSAVKVVLPMNLSVDPHGSRLRRAVFIFLNELFAMPVGFHDLENIDRVARMIATQA